MSVSRQKRVEKAQMRVLFQVPFFAPGVAKLPVVFDDSVETACTDGQVIKWNGKWFDSLPDAVLPTVLCHEVAHCLLGHLWRAPSGVDWKQWNIATDHAVNLMLKEFGSQVVGKNLADPFPFPDPADAYCANPSFKGMAEEVIYGMLSKSGGGGGGGGGGQGKSGTQSGQSGQGQGKPQGQGQGQGQGKPAAGSMPSFGDMQQPKPGQGSGGPNQQKLQNEWDNTMVQSAAMAKGRGDCPGSVQRYVDGLVNPGVPWWEVLRSLLREQCSDDWDFQHPAMEYSDGEFILPSMHSDKVGSVVFATDTSGSIDQDMLKRFQAEKQNCLDEMHPAKLVDIYCDTRVQAVREYAVGDEITRDCPGGGGTDFRPVFNHVADFPSAPKALVYLTDLDGTFPDEHPGFPVIWVTWEKDKKAPFGETIYAGE